MKSLFIIPFLIASVAFMACNNKKSESGEVNSRDSTGIQAKEGTGSQTASINDIVAGYLEVKNALANDNAKEASSAADRISSAVEKMNTSTWDADQKRTYDELKDDISEHAAHIKESDDLAHQREHFDLLSTDLIDLVKATGSSQTLYLDFCPMYNNEKGASWLSETKEIKNPYYGKEMIKCGEVKEEIKPK